MFKLFRKFTAKEWVMVVLIALFTVGQVFVMMQITDYVAKIIQSITYLYYQGNPQAFSLALEGASPGAGLSFNAMFDAAGRDWNVLVQNLESSGVPEEGLSAFRSVANASINDIWMNALWMLLLALAYSLIQVVNALLASYVTATWTYRIRKEVDKKVTNFGQAEIKRFSTPSLVTRVTNDAQHIDFTVLMMLRMVFAAPVTAIWAIFKIRVVSSELTWASIIAILIIVAVIAFVMVFLLPRFRIVQKQIDRVNALARENLSGIRVVRAYNAEAYQENKFEEANFALTKTQLFTSRVSALFSPVLIIVMDGLSLSIYWLGSNLINAGTIDYATVTSFMMLSTQIIMSFLTLLFMFVMWPRASACAKRINEVLDTKTSIEDPKDPKPFTEEGTVEFHHVSFTYPDGASHAIEDIDFVAHKGDRVAIIGATGSGKSTLIHLVNRLYDVSEGEVKVDGVPTQEADLSLLRHKVGLVPQKGVLFKGSILDNLRLGKPELTEEEATKALHIACADFVFEKEGGLSFEIAQGGKNVSGGQKQRLCIARALAMEPEILVFDDSFSALDYATDRKLRDNLKEHCKDVTTITVATRIGTIMDADLILVLDEGKVVGKGNHKALLEQCPTYRGIALSQLSEEELGL